MSSKSPIEINEEVSHSATPGGKYEVFLSFRGPDTRSNITDHLYHRLIDAGIRTYRDDEEIRKGEKIEPELLKGIRESTIAIPIFSKRYAESKWCLKELAQIVKRKRSSGLKVMPIFYDVTPSEVRHQTGDYAKAFESHERCHDENTVKSWRVALREVGESSGWEVHSDTSRYFKKEGELVKEVTKVVLRELKKAYLNVTDYLVGVEHHIEEILGILSTDISAVQIFGIYGMGGIGKTTLAKLIYNHLIPNFESHSFLENIREIYKRKGMKSLYKSLIRDILGNESANISNGDEGISIIRKRFSNKKVVILLDDVDEKIQLENLIGKRDWFGRGSLIIITTRDKRILEPFQVESYELCCLESHLALQLFCKHAFRKDNPPEEYSIFSQKAVQITGGLPLALEVFGSLLSGKSREEWDYTLNKLQKVSHKDVRGKLSISFDALDAQQKNIFLDIACFFIGWDYELVIYFWEEYEFPKEATEVLQQMCLIKIKEGKRIWMHDQLRDLGREIVQEGHTERRKCSRLWNTEETTELFRRNMVGEDVRGICLDMRQQSVHHFWSDKFANLPPTLRFLRVDCGYSDRFNPVIVEAKNLKVFLKDCLSRGRLFVFSELRWLSLRGFPGMRLTRNVTFEKLAILELIHSEIESSWSGWSHIKMAENLKVLNLTGCRRLVKTPDLSHHPFLEQLILEGCWSLVEIDKSISVLQHLVIINLRRCKSLKKLPKELSCVESLEELIIDETGIVEIPSWPLMRRLRDFGSCRCSHLEKVSSLDFAVNITFLSLSYSKITILPESIGKLVNLINLFLFGCKGIKTLPESIGDLVSLKELYLSLSGIVELPNTIGNLGNLKSLYISHTPLRRLPTTIGMMKNLSKIQANGCSELHDIPMLPQSLTTLIVSNARTPRILDLSNLINLKGLNIMLNDVPVDPFEVGSFAPWRIGKFINLEALTLGSKGIISLHEDLSSLKKLKRLQVESCPNLVDIHSIDKLENLESLVIKDCTKLQRLPDLSSLKKLKNLSVRSCPNLVEIPGIDIFESLAKLSIQSCEELQSLPDLSNLKKLKSLWMHSCPHLVEYPGIYMLENLEILFIRDCTKLQRLPDLSSLKKLKKLYVWSCRNLVEIPSIDTLENLTSLNINQCEKLQSLSDLSNLKKLEYLCMLSCPNLVEYPGIDMLENLEILFIKDCTKLQRLPDLSSLKNLCILPVECYINGWWDCFIGWDLDDC